MLSNTTVSMFYTAFLSLVMNDSKIKVDTSSDFELQYQVGQAVATKRART